MARKQLFGIAGLLLACCILAALFNSAAKATENSWLNSSISVNETKTYSLPQDPINISTLTGNKINCLANNFDVKYTKMNVCAYNVSAGMYGNGYLRKNGTGIAGHIEPSANYNPIFAPPYSSSLVELESAGGYGYKVYIINDAYSKLETNVTMASLAYKIPPHPNIGYLKNASGAPMYIDYNTVTFSENGQWMLADSTNTGFVRINLSTGEILPFRSSFSAGGSSIYSINAVSNDGKLAIVGALAPFQKSDLFDLSNCRARAGQTYQSCSSRDLQQFMSSKRDKYVGFQSVKFITNEAIQAYATYAKIDTSTKKIGLFNIDIVGGSTTKTDYLALGDSFSAGEGAYSYRDGTDFADNRCHTSTVSYPYVLTRAINSVGGMQTIACSGAKIKDVILQTSDESRYNERFAQAKKKIDDTYNYEIYGNYLPGYRMQKNFVERNRPNIVTMSIGGNDIGFSSIISKCVIQVAQDCYHYYEDRKELVQNINAQFNNLVTAYQQIKQYAATDAKIYIVGYPKIAKTNGNCANNVHFSNEEIEFSNQLVEYLNSVISMAANYAGVYYVDVRDAFDGHKLCETNSTNVAVNGLTAGDGGGIPFTRYPLATESYHPNALGQALLATKIMSATQNFSVTMPTATTGQPVFASDKDVALLANAPKENRTVWPSSYSSSLSGNVLYKNQQATINAAADEYSLAPNYTFSLAMHSTPTNLGTTTTDSGGNLDANITIPDTIEPGYHTLHVRGKNILGEDIDLQKIVYVAAGEADMNGDGVSDSTAPCGVIVASGIDYDEDGVDDACDGQITEPKPKLSPTPMPTPNPEVTLTPTPAQELSLEPIPTPTPTPTPTELVAIIPPTPSPEPSIAPTPETQISLSSANNTVKQEPAQNAPTPTTNTLVAIVSPSPSLGRNTGPVATPTPQPDTNTATTNSPTYTAVEGVSNTSNVQTLQTNPKAPKLAVIILVVLGGASFLVSVAFAGKFIKKRYFA